MTRDFGVFPVAVNIYIDGYEGARSKVSPFVHRSGWLMASEARMTTPFGVKRRTLIAAISDHDEIYPPYVAARLLDMPVSLPKDAAYDPPGNLEEAIDGLYWDFLGATDRENLRNLREAEERTDAEIRDFEARCVAFERKLWAAFRNLRAERRKRELTVAYRAEIDNRLRRLSRMLDELPLGARRRTAEMRQKTEVLGEAVLSGLHDHGEIERLFVVHWTARRQRRGKTIQLPVFQEEPYSADAWRNRDETGIMHASLNEELAAIRFGPGGKPPHPPRSACAARGAK
jgi:hypothetical protein